MSNGAAVVFFTGLYMALVVGPSVVTLRPEYIWVLVAVWPLGVAWCFAIPPIFDRLGWMA